MSLLVAALLLQAQVTVLENAYVRVTPDGAPCASAAVAGCADRVIVAMGDVTLMVGGTRRAMKRGDIAVFHAGESYEAPSGGHYYEVAFKPGHPPVESPADLVPPDKNVTRYDGDHFLVFEERLAVGDTRARHGHSQRVVIQLNDTRLQQWPEGQPEVIRDIAADRPAFNAAVIHTVKNVGQLPLRGIVIELKPERRAQGTDEAIAALTRSGALARLTERTAPEAAAAGAVPSFVVEPGWPKTLPNRWRLGQIGGLFVAPDDHIWVYQRPRSLTTDEAGALGPVGTDAAGNPVSGLGHPRPWGPHSSCCVPAPSVLEFDREGNVLQAWGGPSDPGFLQTKCRESDGCFWPAREHGIFVDHNGFVYLSGNGTDFTGQFPWAATFGDDSQVLKFTKDGTFVYQIGTAGMSGPNSDAVSGGPNGTPQPYLAADMTVDPKTNRLFIADGYGNRRVLIVDAATGRYLGHFGAYGQNPVLDPATSSDPYDAGPWMADLRRGETKPKFFRPPVHCAKLSGDGLLYVCDRGNNRVQVFDAAQVGRPCANPEGEGGRCGFIREVAVAPETAAGTADALNFSTDPTQSCLYVADLTNNTIYVLNRDNLEELDRIGRAGRHIGEFHWIHAVSIDSQGNLYTGEVDSGSRIQKFLRYGERASCAGRGSAQVGAR